MHSAWIGAVMRGGVHVVAACLKDGDGLGPTNLALLTELAALVADLRGPWLIAGDWNLTPEMLAQSGWLQVVNGRAISPRAGGRLCCDLCGGA